MPGLLANTYNPRLGKQNKSIGSSRLARDYIHTYKRQQQQQQTKIQGLGLQLNGKSSAQHIQSLYPFVYRLVISRMEALMASVLLCCKN